MGFGFSSSFVCVLVGPLSLGAVEKWESWFWISTFPPPRFLRLRSFFSMGPRRRSCGNVGISRSVRDFQGTVERVESLFLAFHAFHSSVISTAPLPLF